MIIGLWRSTLYSCKVGYFQHTFFMSILIKRFGVGSSTMIKWSYCPVICNLPFLSINIFIYVGPFSMRKCFFLEGYSSIHSFFMFFPELSILLSIAFICVCYSEQCTREFGNLINGFHGFIDVILTPSKGISSEAIISNINRFRLHHSSPWIIQFLLGPPVVQKYSINTFIEGVIRRIKLILMLNLTR